MENRRAIAKGEFSELPGRREVAVKNDDAESHAKNKQIIEFPKAAEAGASADLKPYLERWVKEGVPAMGQPFELTLPMMLVNQLHHTNEFMSSGLAKMGQDKSEAEMATYYRRRGAEVIKFLATDYVKACDEVESDKDTMKAFFTPCRSPR